MLSTIFLIVIMLLLLSISLLLWGFFLWVGLRWRKVPGVTLHKLILTTFLVQALSVVLAVSIFILPEVNPIQVMLAGLGLIFLSFIAPFLVISKVFKINCSQSFLAWLPTLMSSAIMLLFLQFIQKPYVSEAFVIPTNAMAPTLLGDHGEAVCSTCGEPAYYSTFWKSYEHLSKPTEPVQMICNNFHVTKSLPNGTEDHSQDRILVAKWLQPKRWDLLVFKFPGDPSTNYVKRLVGLPGETIIIKDGSVFADGQKLTPPPELQGIEYLTALPSPGAVDFPILWGTEARPAKLAEGEYFTLGDFSASSKDSRLWDEGAPGHPPYAVPEELIIGVATHCYWPFNRMRAFR